MSSETTNINKGSLPTILHTIPSLSTTYFLHTSREKREKEYQWLWKSILCKHYYDLILSSSFWVLVFIVFLCVCLWPWFLQRIHVWLVIWWLLSWCSCLFSLFLINNWLLMLQSVVGFYFLDVKWLLEGNFVECFKRSENLSLVTGLNEIWWKFDQGFKFVSWIKSIHGWWCFLYDKFLDLFYI